MNDLPFSKPRYRFYGDVGAAQRRAGDADLLMHQVRLFCETAGVPVYAMRQELADGTVIEASRHGPFDEVRIWGRSVAPLTARGATPFPEDSGRLVWMAEGIVITPRTTASPDGFGLPDTEDDIGTPGGPLREVLLNRFTNNNYPDAILNGGELTSAPLFHVSGEEKIQANPLPIAAGDVPQFSSMWVPVIQESRGSTWYAHRPQIVGFIDDAGASRANRYDVRSTYLKGLFDGTNAYRAANGMGALFGPVRGWYSGLADAIVAEMWLSGNQSHDSVFFRTGYQTFDERIYRYGEPFYMVGENLATSPTGNASEVVSAWIASPEHSDNMLYDWADDGEGTGAGIMQLSAMRGTLTSYNDAPYPQTEGLMTGQCFYGANRWLHFLPSAWTGELGSVSWKTYDDERFEVGRYYVVWYGTTATGRSGVPAVTVRGRFINLPDTGFKCVHGAALTSRDGEVFLRVALGYEDGARKIEVREWPIWDVAIGKETGVWERDLDSDVRGVSRVNFSSNGSRAVFAEYIEEPPPASYILNTTTNLHSPASSTSAVPPVGYSLRHVVFDDGFAPESKQELFVEVIECSGGASGNVRYHTLCEGEYTAFKDFNGNSLVAATCVVRWEVKWFFTDDNWTLAEFSIDCEGQLRFPGGSSFQYCDAHCRQPVSDGEFNGYIEGLSGFFTNIAHLDIRRPDNTVYLKYDIDGESGTIVTKDGTATELPYKTWKFPMDVMFRGEAIKHADNVAPQFHLDGWWDPHSTSDQPPYIYPPDVQLMWENVGQHVPSPLPWSKTATFMFGNWSFGYMGFCAGGQLGGGSQNITGIGERHHASLLPQPYEGRRHVRTQPAPIFGQQIIPSVSRTVTGYDGDPVEISWRDDMNVRFVEYDGEYLLAGEIGQVGGLEKYAFEDEDKFFWRSSLSLESLTDLELKDNILPVGVI